MPAKKPIPRDADGTVNIKDARKRMRGHRTDAEIQQRIETEVRAPTPKQVRPPKYLPDGMRDEFRKIAKQLIELQIFAELDYDMLARYLMARAAWTNVQNRATAAIIAGDRTAAGGWTKTASIYFGQCQSCAAALGLSVSARCRLVIPKADKPEEDAMSKMLDERMRGRRA